MYGGMVAPVHNFRQFSFIRSSKAAMGGGAHSTPFGTFISPKRRVRAAHGRARAAKTHQSIHTFSCKGEIDSWLLIVYFCTTHMKSTYTLILYKNTLQDSLFICICKQFLVSIAPNMYIHIQQCTLNQPVPWDCRTRFPRKGRIFGRNPDNCLKSFPSCYSQSPLQLCLEIFISSN